MTRDKYAEYINSYNARKNPILKWAQNLNNFFKEEIQMAKKDRKRC